LKNKNNPGNAPGFGLSPNGAILIKPGATPQASGDINIAWGNAPGFRRY